MTAVLHNQGRARWSGSRDDKGHVEYKLVNIVRAAIDDGPQVVKDTPGLPLVGSLWNFGNDKHLEAFCTPKMTISPLKSSEGGEPQEYWKVEQTFTTKPYEQDLPGESLDNPLLEPQKLSGSFVKYTQAIQQDKDGNLIESSSHEVFQGPEVQFDFNRPTVRIEQNVVQLGLALFSSMVDTLNTFPLWGLGTRRIKLSNVSWRRRVYSGNIRYYTRVFEFDVSFSTFDRLVEDKGYLKFDTERAGGDRANPSHYIRHQDNHGNNVPGKVGLDGNGSPRTTTTPTIINIQYYQESNFLLLGIPISLLI